MLVQIRRDPLSFYREIHEQVEQPLALLEMAIVLATVLEHWTYRLDLDPGDLRRTHDYDLPGDGRIRLP
jgi:hypothetical protein